MRKTNRSGSFLLCLLFNMLLNLEGLIPASVFLALHFIMKWSIWWAVLAAGGASGLGLLAGQVYRHCQKKRRETPAE